jgi:hypothetical protein
MRNDTFFYEAMDAFNRTLAECPYTLAMGNSGLFLCLPNITAAYSDITSAIRYTGLHHRHHHPHSA